ncbi:MAG: nicotinate (nicotinamide) nucleotide adenylyltransferase [Clostridia bacterium]|nr:nicotinate (nicotinamide) nucleotide adenylyltransferase [Clostridia bacterium]
MKIGILGGSFDPLHKEHLRIIENAREKVGVDRVILLPTYNPPHKESVATPYEDRVNMLRLYADKTDFVSVDEMERELSLQKSYAYLVLAELKKKHPTDELYYLIGSDSLRKFDSWARPDEILKSVRIAVVNRGDDDVTELAKEYSVKYNGEIKVYFGADEESSSSLRLALELKQYDALSGRLLPEILDYIRSHKLYSRYGETVDKLRLSLSERTFNHSVRTAIYAVTNAWRVWESYDRALVAGLLHDCAKGRAPLHPLESYPTTSLEVVHQYDGAELARDEYGVTDEVILDAIRYHTTAKPNMSPLGKLVYLADKLESGRSYPSVNALRESVEQDFESGFALTLAHGVDYLKARDLEIDVLTFRAYEWYNKCEE